MSANEMTAKVRELKELKAMAEELAQEITAIEDAIKAELRNSGRVGENDNRGAYRLLLYGCRKMCHIKARNPARA